MLSRRTFIAAGAGMIGSLALRPFGLLPAMAVGSDYRALVCVFLFGGNDSNNTVVPMDTTSYNAYLSARGTLALTGSNLTSIMSAKSGQPVAFHASLKSLASLFGSGELAVVTNVGALVQPLTRDQYQAQLAPIPLNLFSHPDQQSGWQTSIAQGKSATGWGGRVADYIASQGLNTSTFPTFFSLAGNVLEGVGAQTEPVASSPGTQLKLTGPAAGTAALNNLLTTNTGMSLTQAANDTLANGANDANALNAALGKGSPLTTQFPSTSLGAQLKQVAQIIQVSSYLGMRRQIFFCALEGFDTHSSQAVALTGLYPQVDAAAAAFYNAMLELGVANNVTLFTESDFGRTCQPNTQGGSDHAWGGHQLVLGGAVLGKQIYGQFPSFQLGGPDDADVRGRWIPNLSVDQYGATLCSWFGLPPAALSAVFPNLANFSTANLGFLG